MLQTVGPVLFARGADDREYRLSAILVTPDNFDPPVLVPVDGQVAKPGRLYAQSGRTVWRYDFSLPARGNASYRLGDAVFPVAADLSADVRIAFVSCNGQEHADADRPATERNAMWRRLAGEHDAAPFNLLLHGGDQLYADEVLQSHSALAHWAECARADKAVHAFSADMREAAEHHYFQGYLTLYARSEIAYLAARVPSVMMWDDHDIFDGWGSLPEKLLDGQVGRGLFDVARRMFMLFQLGASDAMPSSGADASQCGTLTQVVRFPRLSVIAPDLRSERRPTRVMGPAGWAAFDQVLAETERGSRILVMSSVPVLGPRLSWIEKLLDLLPRVQKYEDDMLDQWQSRSHSSGMATIAGDAATPRARRPQHSDGPLRRDPPRHAWGDAIHERNGHASACGVGNFPSAAAKVLRSCAWLSRGTGPEPFGWTTHPPEILARTPAGLCSRAKLCRHDAARRVVRRVGAGGERTYSCADSGGTLMRKGRQCRPFVASRTGYLVLPVSRWPCASRSPRLVAFVRVMGASLFSGLRWHDFSNRDGGSTLSLALRRGRRMINDPRWLAEPGQVGGSYKPLLPASKRLIRDTGAEYQNLPHPFRGCRMSASHNHALPSTRHERSLWIALGLTSSFMVAEVVAGVMTGSLALISDAWLRLTAASRRHCK